MDVHEAVDRAKAYATDLFGREGLSDPRLEEIELDERSGIWSITVGMLRPLSGSGLGAMSAQLAAIRGEAQPGARIYRVVRLNNDDGRVLSVKMREELT